MNATLDGRKVDHGKIGCRLYPARLRPLSQGGRVSISKGRRVRREKCPRR